MSWSEAGYQAIAEFVGQQTGLALAQRHDSIEQGVRRAMARTRSSSFPAYLQLLASDSNALDDLVVELTIGETYFFREPGQFEFLRREVCPSLRERCVAGHSIRAWSAGCASGEEACTLAMLFEEEGLADQAHVLATDISRAALARAGRGVYGAWSLRGENRLAALLHLTQTGAQYRVHDSIRRRITFEYLNLALDVYPSLATGTWGMDVILCRNVLIYLDRETIRRTAQRLCASLAEGGWLLTASSDPPLADDAPLEPVVAPEGVFYRKPARALDTSKHARAARSFTHLTPPDPPDFPDPGLEDSPGALFESPSGLTSSLSRFGETNKAPGESSSPGLGSLAAPAPDTAAQDAFAQGEYARTVELTREWTDSTVTLHMRALANLEPEKAEQACAVAVSRYPLSAELHYLHGMLLVDLRRDEEAIQSIRRVIYLDRTLSLAHFTLGSILKRRGDLEGPRRAYRNARDLCCASQADMLVPLSEGEHAGRLAEAAAAQLALLDDEGRTP